MAGYSDNGTGTQAVEACRHYGLDEPVDSVQTMAEPEPEPPAEDDYRPIRVKKGKKKGEIRVSGTFIGMQQPPSKQETLWAKFVALRRTSVSLNAVAGAEEVPPETEDLVSHAKVYVFADYHGIDKLTTISYNNLHRSLIDLNLQAKTLAGVIALFQYSYETLVPDDLRDLIVLFAACEVERLWKVPAFRDLLNSHAELGSALVGAVINRLA